MNFQELLEEFHRNGLVELAVTLEKEAETGLLKAVVKSATGLGRVAQLRLDADKAYVDSHTVYKKGQTDPANDAPASSDGAGADGAAGADAGANGPLAETSENAPDPVDGQAQAETQTASAETGTATEPPKAQDQTSTEPVTDTAQPAAGAGNAGTAGAVDKGIADETETAPEEKTAAQS